MNNNILYYYEKYMKYKNIHKNTNLDYEKYIKYKKKYNKMLKRNNINNYNFFFDFDLTLVSEHSSGDALNVDFIMKMKQNSNELKNLKDFLMSLLDKNNNVFIITRGLSYNVAKFLLKYVFDCEDNINTHLNNYCNVISISDKIIYIFGSSTIDDINFIDNNKLVNILKIKVNSELKEHISKNNMNYTEKWSITKVIFILFITKYILCEELYNNYFFDDTQQNIDLVKKYIGYKFKCYDLDEYNSKYIFIDIIKKIINTQCHKI